ncbi:UNVERIFIED_ORG: hypothetical protein J2X74_003823 [Bacillus sp. 1751]|nr:hypothetical protein [Bacillus sp. 1751]
MFSTKWNRFMNEVREFFEDNEGTVWFRGHSNIGHDGEHQDYELKSTLFRQKESVEKTLLVERDYIYEFYHTGYNVHKTDNIWSLLFIMQHHGLPTRLLDWTNSLLTALYFARQGWVKGKNRPSIWLLNPIKMNKLLSDHEHIIVTDTAEDYFQHIKELEGSRAIASIKNSTRINAQQGNFTIQGNTLLPLHDEIIARGGAYGDICKEITLDDELSYDLSIYLAMNSVTHFTMFPDLDGLSREIKSRVYKYPSEPVLRVNQQFIGMSEDKDN